MHEQVLPYKDSPLTKKEQVAMMFNRIAFRYDLMNRLLSFGIDVVWRKKMVKTVMQAHPGKVLDVATGTADVALLLSRYGATDVTGVDISEEMLQLATNKVAAAGLAQVIRLEQGDSENLDHADNKFDAVTVAFGVRNFENLTRGLKEIYRVLKPGGKLVILEFSKPKTFPFKQLYHFFFVNVCPLLGKWITRDKQAYEYLFRSVQAFPEGDNFLTVLAAAGFKQYRCKPLTFGISSLYVAAK